jgi:hypothetical protein
MMSTAGAAAPRTGRAAHRPVALKFLAAAEPSAPARDRLLIEARAIARLQHPNVVGICSPSISATSPARPGCSLDQASTSAGTSRTVHRAPARSSRVPSTVGRSSRISRGWLWHGPTSQVIAGPASAVPSRRRTAGAPAPDPGRCRAHAG